jgi:hypothetical protein
MSDIFPTLNGSRKERADNLGSTPLHQEPRHEKMLSRWGRTVDGLMLRRIATDLLLSPGHALKRRLKQLRSPERHNHSSDDSLIQYGGQYSRHSRGRALTEFASGSHEVARCLKPS